jgi:hypothetical protein
MRNRGIDEYILDDVFKIIRLYPEDWEKLIDVYNSKNEGCFI